MSTDDTLFQALADLKIAGSTQKENLLNLLGVESNMKLYSCDKTKRQYGLRASNEKYLKLIVCTGCKTIKGDFDLKTHNNTYGKLE